MDSGVWSLVGLLLLGALVCCAVLAARYVDQRARDGRRRVFVVAFPRTVTDEQVEAFLAAFAGLASPRLGLVGRDGAVLEIVGTRGRLTHRLRLPDTSADYFVAQLRAAVRGVTVTELEAEDPDYALPRLTAARELRRTDATRPLSLIDAEAVARTVLSAASGLRRGETVVWQWTVTGGSPVLPGPDAGQSTRQLATTLWSGQPSASREAKTAHVGAVLRLGVYADAPGRRRELLSRLTRAASSVSAPGVRLVPRPLPTSLVAGRIAMGRTPLVASPVLVTREELVALIGWPLEAPVVPGLVLGGSPQLAPSPFVPSRGRVLGRSNTQPERQVAQSLAGAVEHSLYVAPTGAGKTWLAAGVALQDIAAGRGVLVIDPKGGLVRAILERLPAEAIPRTILVDPTDEDRPVPLPLLAHETGGTPELAADTLVGLLRHRYRDLGPRSSDILSSSLYALARVPDATLMDLLPLWSSAAFRARVAGEVSGDPALASFFAWFEGLSGTERSFVLAAPMNKIRPLLQRSVVRNVLAAPRSTFTLAGVMKDKRVVLVSLPEGVLGADATGLLGQVVLARLWTAIQGRRPGASKSPFLVTVDEAPRFVDAPTDLADVLARAREYGVGVTLIAQSLGQLPPTLLNAATNSARTKVSFQTSASDARRMAAEFGPLVTADMLASLGRYEAIGQVSLGGAVTEPFTLRTRALDKPERGRAAAMRAASREQWGVPRAEIESSFTRREPPAAPPSGPVGRRSKS